MQLLVGQTDAALRRIPVYLLDNTDGKTPITGQAATCSAKIFKGFATPDLAFVAGVGTFTEIANGFYYYTLDPTEVDTAGQLILLVTQASSRRYYYEALVLDAVQEAGLYTMIPVSSNQRAVAVMFDDATDLIPSTLDGAAITVQYSKNGAAFVTFSSSVLAAGEGTYRIALSTTIHLDVPGFLLFRFTGSGLRTFAKVVQVVAAETLLFTGTVINRSIN